MPKGKTTNSTTKPTMAERARKALQYAHPVGATTEAVLRSGQHAKAKNQNRK